MKKGDIFIIFEDMKYDSIISYMVDKWRLRHYNLHCDIMLYDLNRNSGESFLILDFDHINDELIVYTEIERTRDGLFDTSIKRTCIET